MKKSSKLSVREITMVVLLVALLVGVVYYMAFYKPMQQEMANIASQSANVDYQINAVSAKIARMDIMQAELEEIFARPQEEITEIAPYDNKEVVLSQLNGILQSSLEYSLNFAEPAIQEDGTVRRNVTMNFRCADFASAKTIINDLTRSHWRCMVSNLSVTSAGDVMGGEVTVNATITFFESKNLSIG